ncbi:MAG: WYL domain-containing protein, partial [Nocardioides sp.]
SAGHRRVRLGYRPESGADRELEADPWAIVVRYGRWYLLGRSVAADAVRTYRIDRVSSVETLSETFEPPAGLDPVRALEEHLGLGWEHAVSVLVEAPLEQVRAAVPRTLGRLEAVDEQTTRLVGSTRNAASFALQLGMLPAPFRVEDGEEVRKALAALGERLTVASGRPAAP